MTANVSSALAAILVEEGQVCLPGIGTLRRTSQGALVSPIEGRALPPSDRVSFNANLVLDDGRLLRYLTAEEGLERDEALAAVDRFTTATREVLDSGRSVVLDGIGRLFKHGDGRISFSPSGENFGKENFGLPALDIKPISRSEKRKIDALADPILPGGAGSGPSVDPVTPAPRRKGSGLLYNDKVREYLWYAAGILFLFVAVYGLFQVSRLVGSSVVEVRPTAPVDRPDIPRDRINVPPPADLPPVDATAVRPKPAPRINESPAPVVPGDVDEVQEQVAGQGQVEGQGQIEGQGQEIGQETDVPPTLRAADNEALIAIGLFGRSAYVEKNRRRLEAAGYEAYTRQEGRLTRLAARISFDTDEELYEQLTALRDRFTADAYVMVLNGEERSPE